MTREQLAQRLLDSYAGSYDIECDLHEADRPELFARAHFYVNESAYMISKKAVMYNMKSDEFVWFFSMDQLTDENCEQCIQYAWNTGLNLAHHDGSDQMVTRLVAVFLCDGADDAALARVKKCKLYKSIQFSLKGWIEFHAIAADLGKESVVANRYGRLTGEHLNNLMHPRPKRGSILRRLLRSTSKRG